MSGDDDPLIPLANARLLRLLIPHARLHIYHGGHLGLVTEAAELAPVIDGFLAAADPAAASQAPGGGSAAPRPHAGTAAASEEEFMTTAPDSDFYSLELLLDSDGRDLLHRVRAFMEKEIEPVINKYWTREEFPHELVPAIGQLRVAGLGYTGYGCRGLGSLLDGMVAMEFARVDSSIATFMGVHSGLAMGSIYLCGSDEQKQRWLPAMARMDKIGAFGLTEPEVGSGAARGLTTTARRDGDEWIIDGQKKWIGNATFADYVIIWARDVNDNQVKGFVVEQGTPGFTTTKMRDKIALRVVQNALHHAGWRARARG